jgi:glycosidase
VGILDLHAEAFDATYAWSWYDAVHQITANKADLADLIKYYAHNEKSFPADCLRMTFVSNHDKNTWEGTEFEQFDEGLEAAIVLSVVSEGIPLIYNGQEAGNTKRLEFFEKDPISWREHPLGELYKKLFALQKAARARWNGAWARG